MTQDETVTEHRRLNGHEFEQTQEDSEAQGSLACCSSELQRAGHNITTEQVLGYFQNLKPPLFQSLSCSGCHLLSLQAPNQSLMFPFTFLSNRTR